MAQPSGQVAPNHREDRGRVLDVGAHRVVVSSLAERRVDQLQRAVVGDEVGELVEHARARRACLGASERLFEQDPGALPVTDDHRRVRRREQPPQPQPLIGGRRQLDSPLRQVGGRHHRAAGRGLAGRCLKHGRDLLVGAVRGRGEMARPLLRAVRLLGEPGVDRAPLRERRAVLHHGRDQRMAEAQAAAVADDHVCGECLIEPARRPARRRHRRLDRSERGLGGGCGVPQHLAGVGRERPEARGEQPPDVRRRLGPGRTDQLERHQRVALTRVMETRERGRGHPRPGPRVDEPTERTRIEWVDGELDRLIDRQGAHERGEGLVGLAAAHGGDHLRAAGIEPPQHEREHRRAGGVEPLPVVDGEQHRCGRRVEQREAREPHHSRIDRLDSGLEQQRGGQRPPLRFSEQ